MKVNTDGVLLGAWAISNINNLRPVSVLDIGTGTGVIALMIAQSIPNSNIDAIDIDLSAYEQASENFNNSNWSNRLRAVNCSLQQYKTLHQYDVILSNPPYFVDDYKSGDAKRDAARHSITLNYNELIENIDRLLQPNGSAYLVVPVFNTTLIESLAHRNNLQITTQADVIAVEGKKPYVTLLEIERYGNRREALPVMIQSKSGDFTEQYRQLTKEFYLKF